MKFVRAILAVVIAGVIAGSVLVACNKPAAPAPASWEPTAAQPRLATTTLWLGPAAIFSAPAGQADRSRIGMDPDIKTLTAELALTPKEIATGMMFRTNISDNEGMLFHLGVPQRASFWMKNCPQPLSCAYIDAQGVILEIRTMEANNTNSIVANFDNVLFVLETAHGWFDRHGIRAGMVIQTDRGPLIRTIQSRLSQ